ncbi:bifunctional [glutamine synthetase] adenylyltransferase/[glutamine synthetase]-adenylyl-L-tyrosine phosphorylase [Microbacterium sp. MPKO10]|uniref:bifunctional [glutamine synthetase] adenylyltransferase/[glutamine synthetase]-adenylyl-L-tyrosine phosphorylase n=1 Tax=Microbacterium sp. MPKO10 TaxID=2989818 RepID=UPI002235FE83|nr:bifunctional [glutamine synthetase] adenylyltransferase/[glutamine synthetase]-adenylyl-L-tyrosine phosphorylase [Microbacterium sp. MPKO10]MCW4459614.1 bifunctional [glutamine synthetase] adenylyltransferase/[glutamine synthetase]-adenylyl-L-tyrosine phosphorylase [Microbacterium sp. MPKO10]
MAARDQSALSGLARAGFARLTEAKSWLAELSDLLGIPSDSIAPELSVAADPDAALTHLIDLERAHKGSVGGLWSEESPRRALVRVVGASSGLAEFLLRHPEHLDVMTRSGERIPTASEMRDDFATALGESHGFADRSDDAAACLLRERYRRLLTRIAIVDLSAQDPREVLDEVTGYLTDAAAAVLEASLWIARSRVSDPDVGSALFPRADVEQTRIAIIGMGKAGARELNYVSDVDVIYVAEPDGDLGQSRAIDVATRLAMQVQRIIDEPDIEPGLWEVDPNLRPEGKDGALVRSLDSHAAYYARWAKSWEFQALLKARPLAGDPELGQSYIDEIWPLVWDTAHREDFVESVQSMRGRVTANIPADEVQRQIKLGPGGLRDVEFTVQLLQLVHGQADEEVRHRGTLPALSALSDAGYIGRQEASEFAEAYRFLRVLEHRLQLVRLRRTHLMPREEESLRVLARAARQSGGASSLVKAWEKTKHDVRELHERLFFRPLLSAVAALPEDELTLSTDQAKARLTAIGFRDPRGALSHIAALTAGVSRRAAIQRHLLPVMLRWFAEGADPDYGLLAFRRLSDALGSTHWFLRMLRDSSMVAERLTRVLSSSRYVGELLAAFPESSAWLENDSELRPLSSRALRDEMQAIFSRHESLERAAKAVLRVRRREILRLALGAILDIDGVTELGPALADITDVTLQGVLRQIRSTVDGRDLLEFAVVGMGRFGGAELGFGSDTDVIYVFRPLTDDSSQAQSIAQKYVSELTRLTDDPVLPFDLDVDLRPEGKNGPLVRSLSSYRSYYERWSLTWEAQALLRARGVAGDENLIADFTAMADAVRYPEQISENDVREVKRIKARVENERLPRGADPLRHVKLGRGSLSDVEWFVQLIQLQHAHEIPTLQTTSTLTALDEARSNGLIKDDEVEQLRDAWIFASRVRSAMTLWLNRTTDVLPSERRQLEGIARILEYPPGSAGVLEEDYFTITRRSRRVFEQSFYGRPDLPHTRAF